MNINLAPSHAMDPVGAGLASGVANIFQAYLGQPRQLQPTDPNEKRPVSTFNMPEAYYGKSKFLRSLVEDFSFTAHQKFFTEVLLPWESTDDIHLEW